MKKLKVTRNSCGFLFAVNIVLVVKDDLKWRRRERGVRWRERERGEGRILSERIGEGEVECGGRVEA